MADPSMAKLGPETRVEDVLSQGPEWVEAFRRLGLKCSECIAASEENLKRAAAYHEVPLERILSELNAVQSGGKPSP